MEGDPSDPTEASRLRRQRMLRRAMENLGSLGRVPSANAEVMPSAPAPAAAGPGAPPPSSIAPTADACPTAGGTGTRYDRVAQLTGGQTLSVCAADYAPLLASVPGGAAGPQRTFPLSGTPDAATLTVWQGGTQLTAGWTYDPANNAVVFTTAPAAGAQIQIMYRKVCGS